LSSWRFFRHEHAVSKSLGSVDPDESVARSALGGGELERRPDGRSAGRPDGPLDGPLEGPLGPQWGGRVGLRLAPSLRRAGSHLARVLRVAGAESIDALFPRLCGVCADAGEDGPWCAAHRLPAAPEGARCTTCAARLPRALEVQGEVPAQARPRCAECRRRSSGLAQVVVLSDYRNAALRDWILAFKHGGRSELAAPLGAALAAHVDRSLGWMARQSGAQGGRASLEHAAPRRLLCPVPLHLWRRLERGYDQSRLLAEVLAADLGVPCAPLLARLRPTAVQGAGGARSRKSNVRGAFALRRAWIERLLGRLPESWLRRWLGRWSASGLERALGGATAARRVLAEVDEVWLVDDVVTSGATLRECARALRRGGAKRVCAMALARAAAKRVGANSAESTADSTRGEWGESRWESSGGGAKGVRT
jgi:predicted amidophosphoribosyltransferase